MYEVSSNLHFAERIAHLTLIVMAIVYSIRIYWFTRFKAGKDFQAPTGTPGRTTPTKGILYSWANIAMPWAMESTRRRFLMYIQFVFFHLGVLFAISLTFVIPFAPELLEIAPVLTNPGDPTYAPAWKADRLRKLFKRHYDWTGKVFPWWVGAKSLWTDADLEEMKDIVFGKCTNCRRCSINCPMGVDFATMNRMTRGLLVSVGVMPEGVSVVSKDQWEIGNQMGVLKEDYLETLEWMQDELRIELEEPSISIPVDKMNANVVYSINPREAKYDPRTIADAAKIFHYAGENWTMPSEGWDMTNFGLFSGDDDLGASVASMLYDKVVELKGKKLVISECGHGYRSTRCEGPNWAKRNVGFEVHPVFGYLPLRR